jgi:tetratricopeptide (TPR) repeat protein
VKIEIAKQMIDNKRYFGSLTFLLASRHNNYQEYFQLLVLWECCLTSFLSQQSPASKYAAKTADNEVVKLIAKGKNNYADCSQEEKFSVWIDTLKDYPTVTIRNFEANLDDFLDNLVEPSEMQIVQIVGLASRVDVKSDSARNKIQQLIETLPVPKLREFYALHQQANALHFRLILAQALINKASTVYWEYYNAAQILVQLGRHEDALEYYVKFYDKALEENDANVIRCAMTAALQLLLYVKTIEKDSAYFFSKCPHDVMIHPEVAKIKLEVDSVIDSRKIFRECRNSAANEVGYRHIDKEHLEEMRAKAIQLASVHPSYQVYYQLFKVCAALGLIAEAQAWLTQSYEANVLMFKVG